MNDTGKRPYEVTPYDGKGRVAGQAVYILSASREGAESAGTMLLRAMGQRGRFRASARPYNPLYDSAFRGYVRALQPY